MNKSNPILSVILIALVIVCALQAFAIHNLIQNDKEISKTVDALVQLHSKQTGVHVPAE